MTTFDTLPIVLVSAATEVAAASVISELINDDVTEQYNKETESPDRVWRLVNKYYSADVRVHALTDDKVLSLDSDSVEAHIIYITEDELPEGTGRAERRAAASRGVWRRCAVRVLLADCARHAALDAWAAAQRADFAPRREAPRAAPPGPFAEPSGVERARAALHAHVWPDRLPRDGPASDADAESEASSDSETAWVESESDELRAVERAESFARALEALASTPRAPGEVPRDVPRAARLDRAEEVVAAFCRALGLDPDGA